ncbi:MAG: Ldh family oxidoreductase [Nitrospinota bacterium]
MVILKAENERSLIASILGALGASERERHWVAEALTEADLRDHASHGLLRLPAMVRRIQQGGMRTGTRYRVRRQKGAALVVEGAGGLGPYVAAEAMGLAIETARAHGVGCVGVVNSNHICMAGFYAELAAKADLVGIVTTTTPSFVHPWGGVEALIGTNPLAVAIPSRGEPILLDMATSLASYGKVLEARKKGTPLGEGWAVGPAGLPTRNPEQAIAGALSPFGGHKGYGLGLVLGLLAGPLVGAAVGKKVVAAFSPTGASTKGDLLLAIDPSSFGEVAAFKERVSEFVREVKSSPPAPGVREILLPGERSYRERERRLRDGIPIVEEVWGEVAAVARGLEVELPSTG